MNLLRPILLGCILWMFTHHAAAQTKLRLSTIIPGTETVQLVTNGDFQLQGPVTATNTHPYPDGWARAADIFADPGVNMVDPNSNVVARALSSGTAAVCKYERSIQLLPATDYVLSAYMWNLGDSPNHVTAVIDMADAPGEPQITLTWSESSADLGYFVYRSFNTANTGPIVALRLFTESRTGTGAAAKYFPAAAQWDNLAITKAAEFSPPLPIGADTNARPIVSITSPLNGTNIVALQSPLSLQIDASASDPDGSVTNVSFYAGPAKLGQTATAPYTILWTVPASGSYQLTAVATDNKGASTVSAPVAITATVPAIPALRILPDNTNFTLYWPTSLTAASLKTATNLATATWQAVTNIPAIAGSNFTVTLPVSSVQRYFTLITGVDPSTLHGKLMMGYQGWHAAKGDGSAQNSWIHWFRNNTPTVENLHFDLWPDTSELDDDELFATALTFSNGAPARLYSAFKQKTVVRHFKWMQDHHLDGVFFQRFLSDLPGGNLSALRNQVATNVRVGAETHGRVFAIMYDISGYSTNTLVSKLTNDWLYLVNTQRVTNSPAYVRHNGKPVVAIWGFGFSGRLDSPEQAQQTINWFKAAGCTVMGGLPTHWRTLSGDARADQAWAPVFRSFDIISPWSVGRYSTTTGADEFRANQIVPDLADCRSHNIDYMPVIFPGFSWANLQSNNLYNQIPRNGGAFYWRQAFNAIFSGCNMLYGAMFDEVDEGTAMYKLAPTPADLPAQGRFVPLNADGIQLPADWYLRLADEAGKMLRRETPLQPQIPITP